MPSTCGTWSWADSRWRCTAIPVFTKDVDILIEPTLENATRTLKALEGLRWGISRELDPADVIAKPFTIVGR